MKFRILKFLLPVVAMLLAGIPAMAGEPFLRLPAVISDHMVLQADETVLIYGWADPNCDITVAPSWGEPVKVRSQYDTYWEAEIKTPKASSEAHSIVISSAKKLSRTVEDILIGQVWLCSGQSNMEWSAANGIRDMKEELKTEMNREIRLFTVTKNCAGNLQTDCVGEWRVCTPESALYFSAVGYWFGKFLAEGLDQPVGLINSSWGGTPIELWMPGSSILNRKDLVDSYKSGRYAPRKGWRVSGAYNAMIHPLAKVSIAGAIWYQGEANTYNPQYYAEEMTLMIDGWRKSFGRDFPFYFVQIAPHGRVDGGTSKALVREQQDMAARSVPKTGMVVISDLVDDVTDIHPKYKEKVGLRLANMALGDTYGKDAGKYRHASFAGVEFKRGRAIVSFDNAEGGIVCNGSSIENLEICDAGMQFMPAQGMIGNDGKLVVWSKEVKNPVAVRYCFSDTAVGNLYDAAGLPVAPFRTDSDNAAKPFVKPLEAPGANPVKLSGNGLEVRKFEKGSVVFTNRNYKFSKVPASFSGFEFAAHQASNTESVKGTITASSAGKIYILARSNDRTREGLAGWKQEKNSEVRYETNDPAKPGILYLFSRKVKAGEKVEFPDFIDFAGATLVASSIDYEK